MGLHYNVRPIQLVLKPSYLLAIILASAGLGAIAILASVPLPLIARVFLIFAVVAATVYHIMNILLWLPWSLDKLELNGKGELHVSRRDGKTQAVHILPSSFVMPYLTILNLAIRGTKWHRSMLVMPDRVENEAFRQLRVWLRWSSQTASGDDVAEEA
jgi:toxin CptA